MNFLNSNNPNIMNVEKVKQAVLLFNLVARKIDKYGLLF